MFVLHFCIGATVRCDDRQSCSTYPSIQLDRSEFFRPSREMDLNNQPGSPRLKRLKLTWDTESASELTKVRRCPGTSASAMAQHLLDAVPRRLRFTPGSTRNLLLRNISKGALAALD